MAAKHALLMGMALALVACIGLIGGVMAMAPPPTSACVNGRVYPDTTGVCECFQCFTGTNCSEQIPSCAVDATAGNPLLFQEYWDINSTLGEVIIPASYRTGYEMQSAYIVGQTNMSGIQPYLFGAITELHELVGNAITANYSIVVGNGGTQLISAVISGYQAMVGQPISVFAPVPYYTGYASWANFIPSLYQMTSSMNLTGSTPILEFITHPNNPDGIPREPVYSNSLHVYDSVYYWPSLTNITGPVAGDVMIFSLSKLTGHAGSRFGWAFVKDPQLAAYMQNYVSLSTIGVSVDSQFRALRLLQAVISDLYNQNNYFSFIKSKLASRWEQITDLFAQQSRFALKSLPGQFYVWIQCTQPADANCSTVFAEANILGEAGPLFGAGNDFVRLEIVEWDAVFDILFNNLKQLFLS